MLLYCTLAQPYSYSGNACMYKQAFARAEALLKPAHIHVYKNMLAAILS